MMNGIKKHLWSMGLTIMIFLVGQTIAAVWWASAIDTRVNYLEKNLDRHDVRLSALETHRP